MKRSAFPRPACNGIILFVIITGLGLTCFHQGESINNPPVSIFSNTIADMNWQEVKKAAEEGAVVLMTTAVIEEHGPHMNNGVDTYLGYQACLLIRKELESLGIQAVIAPPLYWGMNRLGPSFPGSFYIRQETMTLLIEDILTSLEGWGFSKVYNFNAHGDGNHIITGLRTFAKASETMSIEARYLFSDIDIKRLGLSGTEPFVLQYPSQKIDSQETEFADIHAGAFETALMNHYYPGSVDTSMAINLEPTRILFQDIGSAFNEPEKYLPLGYIGNPSGYTEIDGGKYLEETCREIASAIRDLEHK